MNCIFVDYSFGREADTSFALPCILLLGRAGFLTYGAPNDKNNNNFNFTTIKAYGPEGFFCLQFHWACNLSFACMFFESLCMLVTAKPSGRANIWEPQKKRGWYRVEQQEVCRGGMNFMHCRYRKTSRVQMLQDVVFRSGGVIRVITMEEEVVVPTSNDVD